MAAPVEGPARYLKEYYEVDENGCWIWQRAISHNGYGNYGNRGAHRVFYEVFNGALIDGMEIDHLCRVRCCVNPKHLEQVTHKENQLRASPYLGPNMGGIFHLNKTHCPRGHEYDEKNTSICTRKDGRTFRRCKACRRKK